ncbi:MAG: polysaccharide deacetylase family protein [Propionicimonas sp.]
MTQVGKSNRGRALVLLFAGTLLAGCGVTPPQLHPTSPVPPPPSVATTAPAGPTTAPAPATTPPAPVTPTPSNTPTTTPTTEPLSNDKVDCRKVKCVALTFDDGPGPYTIELLSYLEEAQVPATFFMLGERVAASPKVVQAVADAGHQIGVHTWDHRRLILMDAAHVRTEITSTIRIIKRVTGARPRLMRPPYGETNSTVAAQARRAKVAQILWDVDTLDWKTLSTKKTIKAAVNQAKRGSIVLMHDIHPTTVAAVPGIIKGLRKKGYTFVTVGQLLGKTKPGLIYSHA